MEREEITPEELGPPITKSEFEKALNELKLKKKSYGVDNIPAELLLQALEEMKYILYCLTNNLYTTGKIPDNFKRSVMVMLPKKSKSTKCEEY